MILGLDGKRLDAGEMVPWDGEDKSTYVEATEEQMKMILAMFAIFQEHIKEDPLFVDGVPDMEFKLSKFIRLNNIVQ